MPRRPLSRRKIGVLAAALILSAAAALSLRGPAATGAAEASPLPPAPSGALLARLRAVLPTLVLNRAEARALDFDIQSNTFDNQYPPDLLGDVPLAAPGPDAELADDDGVLRGRVRARQGREPAGPLAARQRRRGGVGVQPARRRVPQPARAARPLRSRTRRRARSRPARCCSRCPAPGSATSCGCAGARSCARPPASGRAARRWCRRARRWPARSTPRSRRSRSSPASRPRR